MGPVIGLATGSGAVAPAPGRAGALPHVSRRFGVFPVRRRARTRSANPPIRPPASGTTACSCAPPRPTGAHKAALPASNRDPTSQPSWGAARDARHPPCDGACRSPAAPAARGARQLARTREARADACPPRRRCPIGPTRLSGPPRRPAADTKERTTVCSCVARSVSVSCEPQLPATSVRGAESFGCSLASCPVPWAGGGVVPAAAVMSHWGGCLVDVYPRRGGRPF